MTAEYKNIEPGTYVDFNFIWLGSEAGFDPQIRYCNSVLSTKPDDGTPQSSAAAVILFKAPKKGLYKVEIDGKASVQNPSAGHAVLTIYLLKEKRSMADEIKVINLNTKKDGAFGGYPDSFTFSQDIQLDPSEELAVRIQTVNPGPASAGNSSVDFTKFTISPAASK